MNIDLVEVLWKYGMFPAAKLPAIASQQLIKGVYGVATAEIAGMSEPSDDDIGDLFERAILEIKKNFMDEEQMPEVIAKGLVNKEIIPADAVYILSKLYKELDFPEDLKIFRLLSEEYSEYIPPKYIHHLKPNKHIHVFKRSCEKNIVKAAAEFLSTK